MTLAGIAVAIYARIDGRKTERRAVATRLVMMARRFSRISIVGPLAA